MLDIFITLAPRVLAALNLASNTRAMDTTLVPHRITLRSGHRGLVRALRPEDAPGLAEAFEQLSETSRYRRFFTAKPHLSEQCLAFLTAVDHHDHEALVAVAPGSGQLAGVARFIRSPRAPDFAELAVTVPAMLRGWLDLSQKIIATMLVPVSAFCDNPRQAVPTATAPEPPEDPRPSPAGCRLDVTN